MTRTSSGLPPSALKVRPQAEPPSSVALVIPDPRVAPVPFGWAETAALPAIEAMESWSDLSDAEAQLAALVSFLESHQTDTTEFLKAQRMVEKRKADLLGPVEQGRRTDLEPVPRPVQVEASKQTVTRWRRIADNWDWLLPHVLSATSPSSVSQSRLLKMIDEHTPAAVDVSPDEPDWSHGSLSVLRGSFQERLATLPDHSVDLIITDPPYPKDSQGLWSDLAKLAASKLAPTGYLMAMSGKIHLDEIMVLLSEHLTYGWVFCWPLPGSSTRILGRNIRQTWKPVLAYTTGTWARREPVEDTMPVVTAEKGLDGWQQTVAPAQWLIERFAPPDGLVVDPFLGSGSFGIAARDAGRRFIGVELRADRFETATERLA